MNHSERMKRITEHFTNVSKEEFRKNLLDAGLGSIKSGPLSTNSIITEDELTADRSISKIIEELCITSEIKMKPVDNQNNNNYYISNDYDMDLLGAA
ncbi:hypothetical protein [Methanococcus maripaludis]|uniref:Uncharacterized protein n=1 Tax=Methanococcus maripaludis TaxID=39152 RepID=A0A7J9S1L0_METMI|nr:hypothetical protein [Methanococcus maripaludis]MBB6068189.1 hypothetical protein [Methanococcus maripaludis]